MQKAAHNVGSNYCFHYSLFFKKKFCMSYVLMPQEGIQCSWYLSSCEGTLQWCVQRVVHCLLRLFEYLCEFGYQHTKRGNIYCTSFTYFYMAHIPKAKNQQEQQKQKHPNHCHKCFTCRCFVVFVFVLFFTDRILFPHSSMNK